jgi:hypothetical protein
MVSLIAARGNRVAMSEPVVCDGFAHRGKVFRGPGRVTVGCDTRLVRCERHVHLGCVQEAIVVDWEEVGVQAGFPIVNERVAEGRDHEGIDQQGIVDACRDGARSHPAGGVELTS